jgi:hypothetical protein
LHGRAASPAPCIGIRALSGGAAGPPGGAGPRVDAPIAALTPVDEALMAAEPYLAPDSGKMT